MEGGLGKRIEKLSPAAVQPIKKGTAFSGSTCWRHVPASFLAIHPSTCASACNAETRETAVKCRCGTFLLRWSRRPQEGWPSKCLAWIDASVGGRLVKKTKGYIGR